MLSHINAVYSKLKSGVAKGEFLTEITAGNTRVAFALMTALNGIKDIKTSSEAMADIAARGTIGLEKYMIMHDTFAGSFNRFTTTLNNAVTQSIDTLTPAFAGLM